MRISLGRLRQLIHEATYDLSVDKVRGDWSNEFEDAIEFVICQYRLDPQTARGHVISNWVFDTLEHDGNTFLLARDESSGDALAYQDRMGGWYFRMGDNNSKCRQTGSQRGTEQSDVRSAKTIAPPARSGTAVSG